MFVFLHVGMVFDLIHPQCMLVNPRKYTIETDCFVIVIVMLNSRFLQRPCTKAKSREPAYSQTYTIWQAAGQIQRVRLSDSQTAMVDGVWSWDGNGGRKKRM